VTPIGTNGIGLHRDGRVATLYLSRPPLNILDLEALQALERGLAGLAGYPDLHLLVVRGTGGRAFSAGVAVQDHVGDRIGPALAAFHGAIRHLRELPVVTLALVEGHCLGGGLELALACDLVVASDDSNFGLPEIQLGCYPPVAAALLPRLVGRARALELMLTGRSFDSAEAERLGLLTRRVPRASLDTALEELSGAVLSRSAAVGRLAKRAVRGGEELPFSRALDEAERIYLQELTATADMAEGIAAFLEKRPPIWKHE
jgi:cyclohexa-1,5-dienecarbonyl-CoA hydratase